MVLADYLSSVGAALRKGDMRSAIELSEKATIQGIEHPNLLTLAAHGRMNSGKPELAVGLLERARDLNMASPEVLNTLGLCLGALGRNREAIAAYDTAIGLGPKHAFLHFNKSIAHYDLGELQQARRELEKTIAIEPAHAEALGRLAALAAHFGETGPARQYAARALALAPRHEALLALATVDIEEGKFGDAQTRLEPLLANTALEPLYRSNAQNLMGDALDGLDRTSDAFEAYTASKRTLRDYLAPTFAAPGVTTALARTQELIGYFKNNSNAVWRARGAGPAPLPVISHAFLVGFPRSGTTLLEQVLASHPQIEALQEVYCLVDSVEEFINAPGGIERLEALKPDEIATFQQLYWSRVDEAGMTPRRSVFVDKMPLYSVYLCLMARLFPSSKILFAVRDPRDVVLSCFRRRLLTTAQMYEVTTIEGAAIYYDAVMRLADIYRDKLGLSLLDVRHEDTISDFEGEMRRILEFLGVEWDGAVRGFAADARKRAIGTPSAMQVVRGLSREGVGQWRRYRKELEPVLRILAPWVERFGYDKD